MGKVWDISRPKKQPVVDNSATEDRLIEALWHHGVTIERIFGVFYALEEMANHRSDMVFGNDEEGQHGRKPLTVGDAELAGFASLPQQPLSRQPF